MIDELTEDAAIGEETEAEDEKVESVEDSEEVKTEE